MDDSPRVRADRVKRLRNSYSMGDSRRVQAGGVRRLLHSDSTKVVLDDMTYKQVIFPKGSPTPSTKNVIFLRSRTFFLDLLYINPDDSEDPLEKLTRSYMIGPFQSCDGQMEVNVTIQRDLLGLSWIESATMGNNIIPVVQYPCSISRADHIQNPEPEEIETIREKAKEQIDISIQLKSYLSMETKKRIEIDQKTLEELKTALRDAKKEFTDISAQLELTKDSLSMETSRRIEVEKSLEGARKEVIIIQRLYEELQIESQERKDAYKILEEQILLANEHRAAVERQLADSNTLLDTIRKQHKELETTSRNETQNVEKELAYVTTQYEIIKDSLEDARNEHQRLNEELQFERDERENAFKLFENLILLANEQRAAVEHQLAESETLLETTRKEIEVLETALRNDAQQVEKELAYVTMQLEITKESLDEERSEHQRLQEELQIEKEERGNAFKLFQDKILLANEHKATVERQLAESEAFLGTTRKQYQELETTLRNEAQKVEKELAYVTLQLEITKDSLEEARSEHQRLHEELQIEREDRENASNLFEDQILLAKKHRAAIECQLAHSETRIETTKRQNEELQTTRRNEAQKAEKELTYVTMQLEEMKVLLEEARSEHRRIHEELQTEREERESASTISEHLIFIANEHRVKVEHQLAESEAFLKTTIKQHEETETTLRNEVQKAQNELHNITAQFKISLDTETEKRIEIEKILEDQKSEQKKQFQKISNEHRFAVEEFQSEINKILEERDAALKKIDELSLHQIIKGKTSNGAANFKICSHLEVKNATDEFSNSNKIGQGDYGSVCNGSMQHSEAPIKILYKESLQGESEFNQEDVLREQIAIPQVWLNDATKNIFSYFFGCFSFAN